MFSFSKTWQAHVARVITEGNVVAPRGKWTKELLQETVEVNMFYPVLTVVERNLNYRFMAAEAFWILSGDNRVETIAPYNSRISEFSDDGETFFGAYGPRVLEQFDSALKKLLADRDTRQAGLTIWRENPPQTKDVPCTVAIFFSIRESQLNVHVFMRSSDVWLGLPYDVFNFSMLGYLMCGSLHWHGVNVTPGRLFVTAASSHLYAENVNAALGCLNAAPGEPLAPPPELWRDPRLLMTTLRDLREAKAGDPLRWWEVNDATYA